MIRVPMDPPGLRRKLDVQWMKGNLCWKARRERWSCSAHSAWNRHWTIQCEDWEGNLRLQPVLVGKIKSRVEDPALSPGGASEGVTCVCARSDWQANPILINWPRKRTELYRGDDRAGAEITRPFRPKDDKDMDVKRQRLDETK